MEDTRWYGQAVYSSQLRRTRDVNKTQSQVTGHHQQQAEQRDTRLHPLSKSVQKQGEGGREGKKIPKKNWEALDDDDTSLHTTEATQTNTLDPDTSSVLVMEIEK